MIKFAPHTHTQKPVQSVGEISLGTLSLTLWFTKPLAVTKMKIWILDRRYRGHVYQGGIRKCALWSDRFGFPPSSPSH